MRGSARTARWPGRCRPRCGWGEQEVLDREFDVTGGGGSRAVAGAPGADVGDGPRAGYGCGGRALAGLHSVHPAALNSETPLSVAITDRDGRFEWRGFPGSFRVQVMPNDLSYPMQLRGGAKAAFSVTWRVVAGGESGGGCLRAPGR